MAPQILDWIAQSYQSNSAPLNASRAVNCFAEIEVQDAKSASPVPVWGSAGIAPFAECGAGPILNLHKMGSRVFAVTPDSFWEILDSGATVNLGNTSVSRNGCDIEDNSIQVVWVDGQTGWYWSADTGVQQITDPNFSPSTTVTFIDGYFAFCQDGTRRFYLSPLNGIVPFDPLLSGTKEATSDLLLATANAHEQLYLFGAERTEVWFNTGNPPPAFPFQRSDGAIIQRGTVAPYSIVLEDNTIFWLGDDLIFYRLNGFVPERLSNHGCESEWQKYPTCADAVSIVYTTFGHKMVTVTFPTARRTWVVDLATKRWHERESWIGSNEEDTIGRWRGNAALYAFNRVLIGDVASGKVGQLNRNVFTEWGDTMRMRLVGPPIHNDRRRVFLNRFELEVESGVGDSAPDGAGVTEYCSDPVEMTSPTLITTATGLDGFTEMNTFLLSLWVLLPEDSDDHGFLWTNWVDQLAGSPGLCVLIRNDETAGADPTISVFGFNDNGDFIFAMEATPTVDWDAWVNILISVDVAAGIGQLYVNDVDASPALNFVLTDPVPNPADQPWVLMPSSDPV